MVLFCTQTGNSENAAKQTAEFGKKLGKLQRAVCNVVMASERPSSCNCLF